jgi:hypothetical protein
MPQFLCFIFSIVHAFIQYGICTISPAIVVEALFKDTFIAVAQSLGTTMVTWASPSPELAFLSF